MCLIIFINYKETMLNDYYINNIINQIPEIDTISD